MHLRSILLLLIFILVFSACENDNDIRDGKSIVVRPSSYYGIIGATISFSTVEETGRPLTGEEIWINNSKLEGNVFTPSQIGTYAVFAIIGGRRSPTVEIKIREELIFPPISIPVLFHINEGFQCDFNPHIEKLNDDFNGLSERDPLIMNTYISFRLARYDNLGVQLSEPGIIRYPEAKSDSSFKATVMRAYPPEKYLNVIVIAKSGGGVSFLGPWNDQFPECSISNSKSFSINDSINTFLEYMEVFKIKYGKNFKTYDGFIGCYVSESIFYYSSFVLAHEVGHVLGLPHPFDFSCAGDIMCMEDTRYAAIELDWDNYKNTYCATGYLIRKHRSIMDYVGTFEGFTYNECERMRHALEFRPMIRSLKSSNK